MTYMVCSLANCDTNHEAIYENPDIHAAQRLQLQLTTNRPCSFQHVSQADSYFCWWVLWCQWVLMGGLHVRNEGMSHFSWCHRATKRLVYQHDMMTGQCLLWLMKLLISCPPWKPFSREHPYASPHHPCIQLLPAAQNLIIPPNSQTFRLNHHPYTPEN